MQQYQMVASGKIIHGRFQIEDVLGEGGSSTVYLVRDLDLVDTQGALFALKEMRHQEKAEQARFLFEGEILKRLEHPALPRIYGVFKDDERQCVCMLLEYIPGPNLEILRRQQPQQRFSLVRMLNIIEPVINAVAYLHGQQPPIIHRDIKPANIVVPETDERAVLVDFGIAREYEADATTTAVRHCSPGYAAPEQYSGQGTDLRTDIYGLGATCYTLVTGSAPADAFQRITTLVSKKFDPLIPVQELAPHVPAQVAQAIAQAMAIGQEQRFACVEDFWQALHRDSEDEQAAVHTPTTKSQISIHSIKAAIARARKKTVSPLTLLLLVGFVLLLLSGSVGAGFWAFARNTYAPEGVQARAALTMPARTAVGVMPSPTTQEHYPTLASEYNGTVYDVVTNTPTTMLLSRVRQENERISGSFSGLQSRGTFTGVLDTSMHIFLTVAATASHPPLFFQGTVKADGSLVGNYCNLEPGGQCTSGYGIWSLVPGAGTS